MPLVWRADGSVRECNTGAAQERTQGEVEPLWIADAAAALVAYEAYPDPDYRCKDMLVWHADGTVQRHAMTRPMRRPSSGATSTVR